MTLRTFAGLGALLPLISPGVALAQDVTLDSGDTAWMLTASALMLFMAIPCLALFYGRLTRSRNILSVMLQCFAIADLTSITSLKRRLGHDDDYGEASNTAQQLWIQLKGVLFSVVHTAIATILKVIDLVIGLRLGEGERAIGLRLHNERGYNL